LAARDAQELVDRLAASHGAQLQRFLITRARNFADVPDMVQEVYLRMLRVPNEELRARGEKIITSLAGLPVGARLGEAKSQVGGGSLPRSAIPSTTLDLTPQNLELGAFAERLRRAPNPVIGYVSGGRYRLDLRTVFSAQDEALAAAIRGALLK